MFCDRCGTQTQEGQRFCSSCGKQMGVAVIPSAPQNRVARHIQLLSILWLVASGLNLLGAAMLFLLGNTLFLHFPPIRETGFPLGGFLHGLFTLLGFLVLAKSLLGFAAGWGMLQRESWARPLALVLGIISLINIPFGTALGIYTLWVLLAPRADEDYRELSRAA